MLRNCGISKSDWKDPSKREVIVTKVNEILKDVAEAEGTDSVDRQLRRITSDNGLKEEA